jgi:hypothetical protein
MYITFNRLPDTIRCHSLTFFLKHWYAHEALNYAHVSFMIFLLHQYSAGWGYHYFCVPPSLLIPLQCMHSICPLCVAALSYLLTFQIQLLLFVRLYLLKSFRTRCLQSHGRLLPQLSKNSRESNNMNIGSLESIVQFHDAVRRRLLGLYDDPATGKEPSLACFVWRMNVRDSRYRYQ